MTDYIKRHPFLLSVAAYLLIRLPFLTRLPMFIDEANYLDWGWRSFHGAGLFYSLYDAKPPLLIWLFGLFQFITPDPLAAGRIVSVLTGLTSLSGIWLIARRLYPDRSRIARYSALLYIATPVFLLFDRQALMESAIAAVGIWIFYFLLRLFSKPSTGNSMALGAVLGLGIFVKTNAAVLAFPVFLLISLHALRRRQVIRYLNVSLYGLMTSLVILSPLLFQSRFWSTLASNSRYSLSPAELSRFPVSVWLKNLLAFTDISFWHLTPFVFLAGLLGLRKANRTLIIFLLLPILVTVAVARTPHLRYLVSLLPLLTIPAGRLLHRHPLVFGLVLIPSMSLSLIQVLHPPEYFRLLSRATTRSHIEEYVSGRNTGYQVNADLDYLHALPAKHGSPVIVGLALNSGNPEAAVFNYLRRHPDFVLTYFDSRLFELDPSVRCFSSSRPFFFIARWNEQAGFHEYFTRVATITNPQNSDYNNVYTFRSDCPSESTLRLEF